MRLAKQLLALLLCALLLGTLALPAFAAVPQTAAAEETEDDPAEADGTAAVPLISVPSDLFSRMEFFLSHSGLFLRMRLIRIVNFFRDLLGKDPILL